MTEAALHPHHPAELAHLFDAPDGTSMESEYRDLLRAVVRATKPTLCLETGTGGGWATRAILAALEANGGAGRLITIDRDPVNVVADARATCRRGDSLAFLRGYGGDPFGFALLDSDLSCRADELGVLLDRDLLTPGAFVAVHDTSALRLKPDHDEPDPDTPIMRAALGRLIERHGMAFVEFPLSRGLLLLRR